MATPDGNVRRNLVGVLIRLELEIERRKPFDQLLQHGAVAPIRDLVDDSPRAAWRHTVEKVGRDAWFAEKLLKIVPLAISSRTHQRLVRLERRALLQKIREGLVVLKANRTCPSTCCNANHMHRATHVILTVKDLQGSLAYLSEKLQVNPRVRFEQQLKRGEVAVIAQLVDDSKGAAWRQVVEVVEGEGGVLAEGFGEGWPVPLLRRGEHPGGVDRVRI